MPSEIPGNLAGRYAPSPSGPLHFGSLVAALASYLQARHRGAAWYMRIEDVDPPRVVPGAADDILRTLDIYGLHWDGPVLYQSTRKKAYAEALDRLFAAGFAFGCNCTRKQARSGPMGLEGPIYPGTCRDVVDGSARSVRLRVDTAHLEFRDAVQGQQRQNLRKDVGDFILRRTDGHYAYQLAVVVDDAYQGVGEVVRGADLLTSTPRQILLQQCLGLQTPTYAHIPLVLDASAVKLSKHSHAPPLATVRPALALCQALLFLAQTPPVELSTATRDEVLRWAIRNWSLAKVRSAASAIPENVRYQG